MHTHAFLSGLPLPLQTLLATTLEASMMAAIVLAAIAVAGRRISPRWRYAMMLTVLARLLLPVSIPSRLSLFNLIPIGAKGEPRHKAVVTLGPVAAPAPNASPAQTQPRMAGASPAAPVEAALALPTAALWIWMAGMAAFSFRSLHGYLLLSRGCRPVAPDSPAHLLLEKCRAAAGVRRKVRLVTHKGIQSIGLMGLLRVRLVVPEGVGQQFTNAELTHIFMHELAHVRCGDLWVNAVVGMLEAVHWFNPFLRWFFARLRVERELACDFTALRLASEPERLAYGETLLKAVQLWSSPSRASCMVAILGGSKELRERIRSVRDGAGSRYSTGLGVAVVATLMLLCLTDPRRVDADVTTSGAVTRGYRVNEWEALTNTGGNATFADGATAFIRAPVAQQTKLESQLLAGASDAATQRVSIKVTFTSTTQANAPALYQLMFGSEGAGTSMTNKGSLWPAGLSTRRLTGSLDDFERPDPDKSAFGPVGILSADRFARVIEGAEHLPGFDVVSGPSCTTLSGRQFSISVADQITLIMASGEAASVTTGPEVLSVATVTPGGSTALINLKATLRLTEFNGYGDGQPRKPLLQRRQTSGEARLFTGQTVVFGGRVPNEEPHEDDTHPFFVAFMTITLVQPNGEPITKESIKSFPE